MRITLLVLSSLLVLSACSQEEMASTESMPAAAPPSAAEVLANVQAAMGTENLSSITVSGDAWSIRNSFRQTRRASPPWFPLNEITGYSQTIDLNTGTSLASGDFFAQNLFYDPPTWQTYTQYATADDDWSAQLNTWLTPWGFIQGAENNGVSLIMQDGQPVLSWMSPENVTSPGGLRYTVNAYINADNLISKTETWVEDNFIGDMHVSFMFSDYQEMDGVMVPATIERWQGGGAIFGIGLSSADANPANLAEALTAPEPRQGGFGGGNNGPAPDPADLVEEVAPGVWQITGGYGSFVIEFENDLVVFESGQSQQRGEVILEAIASISDKPIRFLINSHPHSDHTAGLIPIVRAGIPLLVNENALDFMSMALNTPRTLLGEEALNPQFEVAPAGEVMVLEDDMNRLEIHHIPGLHTDSLLFLYMPEHSLAIQADFTVRDDGNGNTLPYEAQTPLAREIAAYIAQSGMQFDIMLGVHAASYNQGLEDVLMAVPEE